MHAHLLSQETKKNCPLTVKILERRADFDLYAIGLLHQMETGI